MFAASISATRGAIERSSAGSLVALTGVAWLVAVGVVGLALRAVPAPRGRRPAAPARGDAVVLGWVLMIVAMMLPSSVPLVLTFGAIVGRRRRPGLLVALLLVGYLVVWGAFGLAAWVFDRGIHAAVDALPWLAAHPQLIIGATLAAAGLWQFSPLRDRCLDECRSPLGVRHEPLAGRRSGASRSSWASRMARSASAAAGR